MELRDKILENVRRDGYLTFDALVERTASQWHLTKAAVEWELRTMMEYRYVQKDPEGWIVEVKK